MKPENAAQWQFSALDTLFFKESRPMEAIGGAQLQSVFPPPARTLIGAIRTAIGEAHQVDWKAYAQDPQHPLKATIGSPDSLGPLSFNGPFLLRNEQRLFPLPLALLYAEGAENGKFTRLKPSGTVTESDIGQVQLPKKCMELAGAKPLDSAWITHDGLKAFLAGGLPQEAAVITPNQLYKNEERLGIGRDNSTRTTVEGLLYQTRHVRPEQNVAIGLVVKGLPNMPAMQQGLGRLGAEGRLAAWIRKPVQELPTGEIKNEHLLLMLVTHAQFTQGWLPDGLQQVRTERSQTVWEGTLHGVRLRLLCCVVGKPVREGGWDLVQRAPRTMDSLVPAGSCYFFEVLQGDAKALHGKHIGLDTDYGRGEIAVGTW